MSTNILVLSFSADVYSLDDLNSMSAKELHELATVEMSTGGDSSQICTLSEFQDLFNGGSVDPERVYIFFYKP